MKTLKFLSTLYALIMLTWIAFLLDDIRESVREVHSISGSVNVLSSPTDPVHTRQP